MWAKQLYSFFGLIYYLSLYYLVARDQIAFMATFTVAPASVIAGILISGITYMCYNKSRWDAYVGWLLTILSVGFLYPLDVHISSANWIFFSLTSGLGTGMLIPLITSATPNIAQED